MALGRCGFNRRVVHVATGDRLAFEQPAGGAERHARPSFRKTLAFFSVRENWFPAEIFLSTAISKFWLCRISRVRTTSAFRLVVGEQEVVSIAVDESDVETLEENPPSDSYLYGALLRAATAQGCRAGSA